MEFLLRLRAKIVYNFFPGYGVSLNTISGGVLNGKAISLPAPKYPMEAREGVNASGAVSVQVLIDENGGVISAGAVSGHPLLRKAAEEAAGNATFSPTLLNGVPVKVSGILTYNFKPSEERGAVACKDFRSWKRTFRPFSRRAPFSYISASL